MQRADIPMANQLRDLAGWNQTERDWQGYLEFEPAGCFVAEVRGEPAGTATTIRYGDRVGWIGMVLVHPEQRRLGIGSLLLRQAIQYLEACGVRCIKLDATPLGRKVYVPLGFVDEYELSRYEANPGAAAPSAQGLADRGEGTAAPGKLVPYAAVDAAAVAALDAAAFGVPRPQVLAALGARDPELCFASRDAEGRLRGYLIARQGARAVQVGPWSAREADAAEQLLLACLGNVTGRTVFVDVPATNAAGVELVKKYGFRVQRTLTRMFLGENTSPGDPRLVYGISSPEKG